MEPS
jgi:hypothetical protein